MNDYAQDLITRLHERAESYRQSSDSALHTAALLDEAAGAISALLGDKAELELRRNAMVNKHARPEITDSLARKAMCLPDPAARRDERAIGAAQKIAQIEDGFEPWDALL